MEELSSENILSPSSIKEVSGTIFDENEIDNIGIHTTKSKFTIFDESIQYKVADIQRTYGFPSKEQLLGYESSINNFPISASDINKHFVEFPHHKVGFQREKVLHHNQQCIQRHSK